MKYILQNATIVNEGQQFAGSLLISDGIITEIIENSPFLSSASAEQIIDCTGCFLLPGVIDSHVHFREPGLTHKADITTESRAAAYGGVTSYFDMPNTKPLTTTLESLLDKHEIARKHSSINYSFFPGATNSNIDELASIDPTLIPGIKLFMGSSTGNMLVDKYGALINIFKTAAAHSLPVMAHCEDTTTINENMKRIREQMGDDPDVMFHPLIRSTEACLESSCLAASLARQTGAKLHIAHITTEAELDALFAESVRDANITAEATVAHLLFSNSDYSTLRSLIKCNPAIKKESDRDALRRGLMNGAITTIGTDHAPHDISEKQGGAAKAMSGMPSIQFSLVTMLSLVDDGILTLERMVELMCHNPATLFGVQQRGFIREGYHADLTIVQKCTPWTVTKNCIQSKCGWSPFEGRTYQWQVRDTICNGDFVLRNGKFNGSVQGQQLRFQH